MKSIDSIIAKPAQAGMVGDGFRVFNYIPKGGITQKRISPFLMLDFNAAYNFPPSTSGHLRGVDVHPHKGFETVTIAYKGSVAHYDSSGNSGVINPGDVQWMTAGRGILHKEFHEENYAKKGGPFEMVQLWVNLPKKDKSVAPHYQAITHSSMGKLILEDNAGEVNIIAGSINGINGPADTYTPINLFDIKLHVGANFEVSIPQNHNTALLIINGTVTVNNDQVASEHSFVLFKNDGAAIQLHAEQESVVLLMSGEPIDEPIVSYGPFVMNTEGEIREAISDFNLGKFGYLD